MCLEYNKEATDILKKKFGKKDYIFLWKVYEKFPCHIQSAFQYMLLYKPGLVVSNRKYNKLHVRKYPLATLIRKGIHVYTDKKVAQKAIYKRSHKVLVRVKCLKKDLIAAGCMYDWAGIRSLYDPERHNHAAFLKVEILPQDWPL
jgi:hypothetical protein